MTSVVVIFMGLRILDSEVRKCERVALVFLVTIEQRESVYRN